MNKLLLAIAGLLVTIQTEIVSGVIDSNAGEVHYSIVVPSQHTIQDLKPKNEDYDHWFLIKYRDRSMIYICNYAMISPNTRNFEQFYEYGFLYPLTNNTMITMGAGFPTGTWLVDTGTWAVAEDSLCISGYNRRSKCWKEIQYKDVCIGYIHVPKRKKELFDEYLSTFRIDSIKPTGRYVK